MARLCELCGSNLDEYGDRHRCVGGKIAGQRKPTKLEAERIARGEISPADLIPKPKEKAATVQAKQPLVARPTRQTRAKTSAARYVATPPATGQPADARPSIMAAIGELR